MKRELSSEREAADDRLSKKMCLTKGIEFKRKGNEKQHVFNEEVKDKTESATKACTLFMQPHQQWTELKKH